jgi:hypothetical protein
MMTPSINGAGRHRHREPIVDHHMSAPQHPTPGQMTEFMRALEQRVHEQGWDQPALFASVHALSNGAFLVIPVPLPYGEVVRSLGILADEARPDHFERENAWRDSMVALTLVTEAWGNDWTPGETPPPPTDRSLGDVPGSYECRQLSAVDVWGHTYVIHHRRGREPITVTGAIMSTIMQHLRTMTLAIAEAMPEGRADLQALRNLDLSSEWLTS